MCLHAARHVMGTLPAAEIVDPPALLPAQTTTVKQARIQQLFGATMFEVPEQHLALVAAVSKVEVLTAG